MSQVIESLRDLLTDTHLDKYAVLEKLKPLLLTHGLDPVVLSYILTHLDALDLSIREIFIALLIPFMMKYPHLLFKDFMGEFSLGESRVDEFYWSETQTAFKIKVWKGSQRYTLLISFVKDALSFSVLLLGNPYKVKSFGFSFTEYPPPAYYTIRYDLHKTLSETYYGIPACLEQFIRVNFL